MGCSYGKPPNLLAIGQLRCFAKRRQRRRQQIEKRPVTLGQVGRLRKPVVHLKVDVAVVIRMPGRVVPVIPQTLQIGRQRSGP